jgi:hypothetical protein
MTNIFERANGAQPGNKRIAKTLNLRTACDDVIAAVHESVHVQVFGRRDAGLSAR